MRRLQYSVLKLSLIYLGEKCQFSWPKYHFNIYAKQNWGRVLWANLVLEKVLYIMEGLGLPQIGITS